MRNMRQEAASKRHTQTEADHAKRIKENPEAMLKKEDALLASVTRATDVDATYIEHDLDFGSDLHIQVADTKDSKDAVGPSPTVGS